MFTQKTSKSKTALKVLAVSILCIALCFLSACAKGSGYDVVIVGSGGAGLSAAVAAREAGASVLIVEKMPFAGGNTNYATGGLNASETSVQKAKGIADTTEQFYNDTMKGGKNVNRPELVRTLTDESAKTVDWLIAQGMDLSDIGKLGGATNSRAHRPAGGAPVGPHFVKVMLAAAEKAGAQIRYNTKVTGLIEKNGKPAGVIVSADGKTEKINAKAVVIASGGFGANPAIITSYKPELEGFGTTNHPGATGDAFEWVKPFNGALNDPDQIQTHPTVVPVKNIMITEAVRGNGAIMVNRDGGRFEQEMTTRDVMSKAILAQKGKTAYLLFDQGVRESLKAIEGYYKKGLLIEGTSLTDLAGKLNIPAATLEAQVKRYNSFAAAKKDTDFGRADMPRKIEKAPFYAVEVGPAVHHTMGGLAINNKAEVLTADGSSIPGLFAAGEVTGGVHGANRLGGNAMADIAVYGKIAGTNAAAYAKGK
ncbi:flavocytochrome c [Treponema sp. OMZ 840]|uniref:flavocytochrome c n=1 Tax=Treponema sp. OMZ 840 TaxID=244313 RepID=UPI003D92CE79